MYNSKNKSKMRKVSIWTAILVAMTFMCVSCNDSSSPEGIVKSILSAYVKEDYKKAAAIECKINPDLEKYSDDIESLARGREFFLSDNKITSYKIISVSKKNEELVRITVEIYYKDGESKEKICDFGLVAGKWITFCSFY